MIIRFYFFIYSRRINWSNFSKFFNWYYSSWYLLCCCSFSLCFIYRSSFCNYSRIYSLIPFIYRINFKPISIKNSIFNYIFRCKFNFFSSTFFRSCRNTSSLFWLSRFLYNMKYFILNWIINFIIRNFILYIYYLRKYNFKPNYYFSYKS